MQSTAQSETKEAADGGTISSVGGTSQVKRYNRKMAYSQVSRSRSTRGAHKELNPDKSLAAVWPIITPLLACKCSHSSTHTHTHKHSLLSPLVVDRKFLGFVRITCRVASIINTVCVSSSLWDAAFLFTAMTTGDSRREDKAALLPRLFIKDENSRLCLWGEA